MALQRDKIWHVYRKKQGKTITLFFGKTKKNDIIVDKSKKEIKKLRRI